MFPSLPTVGNMTKHRQETMFPQQCFQVCPGLYVSNFSLNPRLFEKQYNIPETVYYWRTKHLKVWVKNSASASFFGVLYVGNKRSLVYYILRITAFTSSVVQQTGGYHQFL